MLLPCWSSLIYIASLICLSNLSDSQLSFTTSHSARHGTVRHGAAGSSVKAAPYCTYRAVPCRIPCRELWALESRRQNHKNLRYNGCRLVFDGSNLSLNKLIDTRFYRATHLLARYMASSCLSVCLVTFRYCIKTAKRRLTQIMPHDSPGTILVF